MEILKCSGEFHLLGLGQEAVLSTGYVNLNLVLNARIDVDCSRLQCACPWEICTVSEWREIGVAGD